MTLDLNPPLDRDDSIQDQLHLRERFPWFRAVVGVVVVCGCGYAAEKFFLNPALKFHGAAEYVMAFTFVSVGGLIGFAGVMAIFARTDILFDRKAKTARMKDAFLFFRQPRIIDMRNFVECLVTAEEQGDDETLTYTVRIVFSEGPDLAVWTTNYRSRAIAIADDINRFWGFAGPKRQPVLRDQQLELKKWLDKQT